MSSKGSIWVSLGLRTANFSKGLKGARGQLTGFQKGMAGLKGMFNPFTIGLAAVAGFGAAMTDAFQTVKGFEKAGSDLEAVLGEQGTAGALKNLSDQAKELGASTAFTATEVRGLQKEFAKLGFNPDQIENMTEATLNLAAAAGVELSEAASNAGSIINAFGLNSQDATHVTDVMAMSFSKSALDMEKFSETMKNASPIARATGVSLEQATAAAGKLADANITGSKAGTDLKTIFSELVKDGKPFQQSLTDIAGRLNGASTKAEKLAIAEKLVGERAKGALLVLANQKEGLAELTTELENSEDAAKDMADVMLDNLAGDITIASSAWEGFILSLEDGTGQLSKSSREVVSGFTNILSGLTAMNSESESTSDKWKRVGNVFIGYANQFVKMASGILSVVDAVAGTDLSEGLELDGFELAGSKIAAFEAQLKKQNVETLNTFAGITKLNNKYQEYGLSVSEAQKRTDKLITSMMPVEEVMPKISEGVDKVGGSTVKLTAAQKEQKEEIAALVAEFGNLDRVQSKSAENSFASMNTITNLTARMKLLKDELNNVEIGSAAFAKLEEEIAVLGLAMEGRSLSLPIIPELKPIPEEELEALKMQQDQMKANADIVGGSVTSAFSNMANGMTNSLKEADTGMGRFENSLKQTIIKLIASSMAGAMAQAISGATASGTATGPGAIIATPTFIATAIGGIIAAFGAIPKFAEGGLVTSEMIGMIGEGKGTTRSNPEVIAPLDKLKNMIGDTSGGMGGDVKFRIEGQDLVGIFKRENKNNKFS